MLCSGNTILCRLAKCCDASIFALAAKSHLEPHDVVRVLRTAFGFIFLNILVTIMSFCIILCVLLCVFYFCSCCIRAY